MLIGELMLIWMLRSVKAMSFRNNFIDEGHCRQPSIHRITITWTSIPIHNSRTPRYIVVLTSVQSETCNELRLAHRLLSLWQWRRSGTCKWRSWRCREAWFVFHQFSVGNTSHFFLHSSQPIVLYRLSSCLWPVSETRCWLHGCSMSLL